MILAIDIGNTNINFALIDKKGRIIKKGSTETQRPNLKKILISRNKIEKVLIVSVMPKAFSRVKTFLKRKLKNIDILVIGRNLKVPLRCEYSKKEIGQDRLVTAFAAKVIYGLPILIVDFGTAVTFDVVSKKNAYLGGLILPGIKMSLESLHNNTSMLPRVYLKKVTSIIGKNTASSIQGGMVYGYASICEGLIKLFKKKVNKNLKVVATGGDSKLISRYAPSIKKIDLDLSFKGLYLLSRQ